MKKSRVMAAAMLMLVAPVVTGCDLLPGIKIPGMDFVTNFVNKLLGKEKPVDPGTDQPEQPVNPTPTPIEIVVNEMPTAVVGEVIDTTKYITCTGSTDSYFLTFEESWQGLVHTDSMNQKFKVDHSGTVNFTVNYGGATLDASVEVVSQLYKDFTEQAKTAGYDYTVYSVGNTGYIDGMYNYGEDYYYDWFSNEGYIEVEDTIYSFSFTLDEDEEPTGVKYLVSGFEPDSLLDFCYKFELDPSFIKCEYVPAEGQYQAYEALVIDDAGLVETFTEEIFGYSVQALRNYELEPTKIEIAEDELEDSDGNPVKAYDLLLYVYGEMDDGTMDEGILGFNIIDLNEGSNMFGEYKNLFQGKPVGENISVELGKLDAFLSEKNFTVSYSAFWASEKNPTTPIANPFVTQTRDELGYYIHDYLMCNSVGQVKAYVTETQTYVEIGSAAHSSGLIAHNGDVYIYEGEEHTPTLISDKESIFDSELRGDPHNFMFLLTDEGASELETALINEKYSNANGFGFTFSSSQAPSLFENLFIGALVETGTIDETIKDGYEYLLQFDDFYQTAAFLVDEKCDGYLMCSVDFAYKLDVDQQPTSEIDNVKISFVWEDQDDDGNGYNYIMQVTIGEIGTTEIPASVVVPFAA